jgi:catechol 2,3-dioxygenase-like lactoylglutathione lyase family enzyme
VAASLLGSRDIVAFVATTSVAKAKRFYRDKLGLPLVEESPFALVFDAHGTMLRVTPVQKMKAAGYTVLGWQVPDIEDAVRRLRKARVRFERYAGMGQDRLGIWQSPGGARVAWFKDPDGNTLIVSQH